MLVWQKMSKMKSRHWVRKTSSSLGNALPETILSVKALFPLLMSKSASVLWVEKPGVVWGVFSSPSLFSRDVNWVDSVPVESGRQLFPSTARVLLGRQEQWANPSLFSQIWLQPPFMWRQTSAPIEAMKTRIRFCPLLLIHTAAKYIYMTQYLVWQGDEPLQWKLVAAVRGYFGDSSQSSCAHSLAADAPGQISTICPQILQGQKVDLEEWHDIKCKNTRF